MEIRPGLRSARSGSHLIFFTCDDKQVMVVRVLHERMNAQARIVRALREAQFAGAGDGS